MKMSQSVIFTRLPTCPVHELSRRRNQLCQFLAVDSMDLILSEPESKFVPSH